MLDVAGILPHSDEMMILESSGLFTLHDPDHSVTQTIHAIAQQIMA
ncbi:MAG: hypothetical protein IGR76_19205 [Synechococcales cyanobacterium T60_A2020_003]|nr:hypothetical protein [Synechococcales cyanobacterium T60_A2020_003]